MNRWPNYPVVYEINAWLWLHELSQQLGETITLATVPQAELERLATLGFDGIWLMGVWQRSPAGRKVAQTHAGLQQEYRNALPDYTDDDVVGSPYSVLDYQVDPALGGDAALATLRQRLQALGLRLMLDFVPNHLARDHRWVTEHPERLVQGSSDSLARQPGNYFAINLGNQWRVFAHGRDPYFDGWTDTVQLDYRQPSTRRAMADILLSIAERCDGVRCDMAMLVTQDTFLHTWGGQFAPPRAEFWPAAVTDLRARHPDFLLLAEVYWNLEWELQQQGFDYTYDKRLYDRLLAGDPLVVRSHLTAKLDYQRHLARFVENHDERRAVEAYGLERSRVAAALSYTLPGLRLVHEGQLEGRRVKLPVQLGRRPAEAPIAELEPFYRKLLAALRAPVFHDGEWRLLEPKSSSHGNASSQDILAHGWTLGEEQRLVVVNLGKNSAQCRLPLEAAVVAGKTWQLRDLLHGATYERSGDEMARSGLYIDLPPFGYHLFDMVPA